MRSELPTVLCHAFSMGLAAGAIRSRGTLSKGLGTFVLVVMVLWLWRYLTWCDWDHTVNYWTFEVWMDKR